MNETKKSKKNKILGEIMPFILAELATAALTVVAALLLDIAGAISFGWEIVSGAALGAAVIILNYLFLTLSVNSAVDNFMSLRGTKEMDDEEAEKFAAENSAPIQNAIKLSFITRTVSMLVALVIAFITRWFNPVATAIPLLAFRPLLHLIELIKGKKQNEK